MNARSSRTSATIVAIGLVVAAIVAPVAATAAGQLVEISSVSGRKADVTRGEQLQVAEASHHQFVRAAIGVGDGSCLAAYTAPATKAVVLKTLVIDFYDVAGTSNHGSAVYVGAACAGTAAVTADTAVEDTDTINLEPGILVPASTTVYVQAYGANIVASIFGYKAPS